MARNIPSSFTPFNPTTPQCTWSTPYAGPNVQYGVGSAIGLTLTSIAEAKETWNKSYEYGMRTGDHFALPNGTFHYGDGKLIKSDTCVRYEPANGHCHGVTKEGVPYSYTKPSWW